MVSIEDEYSDWMVTAAFYASIHSIGALFAADGSAAPSSHTERFRTLKTRNRYSEIFKRYRPLYDASQTTRYDCQAANWVTAEKFRTLILPKYYFPLENSVIGLLKADAPTLPVISISR